MNTQENLSQPLGSRLAHLGQWSRAHAMDITLALAAAMLTSRLDDQPQLWPQAVAVIWIAGVCLLLAAR
ncbi:MAG: hypothetical protein OEZ04_08170, partial [Nitrospinota bacterium]|nr:hypothetical protein [Nitrospinota bacterium]